MKLQNKDNALLSEAYKAVAKHQSKATSEVEPETIFDNFPFQDAYRMVREGKWSEKDFCVWGTTVWNDGAESIRNYEELSKL